MFVAMLPARFPLEKALPARLEAWLNLSQREKARLLVMVRTRAMATPYHLVSEPNSCLPSKKKGKI